MNPAIPNTKTGRPRCLTCHKPLRPWTRVESTRIETPNPLGGTDVHTVDRAIPVPGRFGLSGEGFFCTIGCGYDFGVAAARRRA